MLAAAASFPRPHRSPAGRALQSPLAEELVSCRALQGAPALARWPVLGACRCSVARGPTQPRIRCPARLRAAASGRHTGDTTRAPRKRSGPGGAIHTLRTAGQILTFVDGGADALNGHQAVQCLWRLGLLRPTIRDRRQGEQLRQLLRRIEGLALSRRLDPRGLSNALMAASCLNADLPGLRPALRACAQAMSKMTRRASALDMSTGVWALARAQEPHEGLVQAVAQASEKRIAEFGPLETSKLAWGFATLDVRHARLFRVIAREAASRIREYSPERGLANLAWSFARTGIPDGALFRAIAAQSLMHLQGFQEDELSRLAWAFASLAVVHARLLGAVADHMAARPERLDAQALSNIAWAFSTCRVRADKLIRAVAGEARERTGLFKPQELSNLAWAFAAMGEFDSDLFHSVAQEALVKLRGFSPRNLANLAWAFATVSASDHDLLGALMTEVVGDLESFTPQGLSNVMWASACAASAPRGALRAAAQEFATRLRRLEPRGHSSAELGELAKATSGAVWAMGLVGLPCEALRSCATTALARIGRALDEPTGSTDPPPLALQPGSGVPFRGEPCIVLGLHDRLVVHKPSDWEVLDAAQVHSGMSLTSYLRSVLPERRLPILGDARRHYGFMHRLDVPNSGLILVAATYEAYYDLELQLNSGDMAREYLALCHGWMPPQRHEISAPVSWVGGPGDRRPTAVHPWRGKPSRTRLKVMALALAPGGVACGLLAVRIVTGRRHQIRAHAAYCGQAMVGDAKYASSASASADALWCPNGGFLHRHRLAFYDGKGERRSVSAPLPGKLAGALRQVAPRDGPSGRALERCLGRHFKGACG